ncbi:MAG: hypothetical protein CK424_03580 [Legionella sp.]|nr:MAG: hypothetical protein CK424_03580 [Legionella sp.]
MTTQYKKSLAGIKTSNTALSAAYVLAAYGMEAVGLDLVSRQTEKSIDQFHSPKARAQMLRDNIAGIKTKGMIAPLKQTMESMATHLKGLKSSTTGFEGLKDQIKRQGNNVAQLALLKTFEGKLSSTRIYDFDVSEPSKRLEVLHGLMENDEVNDPRAILAYITSQYDNLLKELKRKKETDLKLIKNTILVMKQQPSCPQEDDINKLEQDLINTLNERYDKAEKGIKTDFETGVPAAKEGEKGTPSLKSLLENEAQKAELELINFVIFSEKSKSKEVVESDLSMRVGAPGADKGKKYRKLSFEDYANDANPERSAAWFSVEAWQHYGQYLMNNKAVLTTPSGLRMNHDERGVSIKFPASSSFYYHYQDRLLGSDMMLMVNEIKRQGKTEIKLTLTVHDPKLRQKIMEEFYYAAHLAGFPDNKIKFQVRFTEKEKAEESIENKTAEEIMGRLGSAPSRAQTKAQMWKQEQETVSKDSKIALNREVHSIEERIDEILERPAIQASQQGPRM